MGSRDTMKPANQIITCLPLNTNVFRMQNLTSPISLPGRHTLTIFSDIFISYSCRVNNVSYSTKQIFGY